MIYKINSEKEFELIKDSIVDGDTIIFKKGVYNLKHKFTQNNLKIVGEDRLKTIITNNDHYHKIMSDYNECNTFRTYTIEIIGNNVQMNNITIKNTCSSSIHGQAVALSVYGDNFRADNCAFIGEQDTLFTGPLPNDLKVRYQNFLTTDELKASFSKQIYNECDIYGDIDFIFGRATALFKNCNIYCLNKRGYVCAPAHDLETEFGYLFLDCKIINNTNTATPSFYLARPWRDFGCVAFIDCSYASHIHEDGFNKWDNTNRDKTARFFEFSQNSQKRIHFVHILNEKEKNDYINNFMQYLTNNIHN